MIDLEATIRGIFDMAEEELRNRLECEMPMDETLETEEAFRHLEQVRPLCLAAPSMLAACRGVVRSISPNEFGTCVRECEEAIKQATE